MGSTSNPRKNIGSGESINAAECTLGGYFINSVFFYRIFHKGGPTGVLSRRHDIFVSPDGGRTGNGTVISRNFSKIHDFGKIFGRI